MVMRIISYGDRDAVPRWHEMTVISQDPSIKRRTPASGGRSILTAKVRVPADLLEPGPRSHRFHVVDYDETRQRLYSAADFRAPSTEYEDRFQDVSDRTLTRDPAFRAQNVYAIAARVLALFESALGRRVPWNFPNHQLYLVPHALAMENAYYSEPDEAIFFGYFNREEDGAPVETCLMHDIVAHETTHAVLSGLRGRYFEAGLPDQPAFHEAFADIVALLSVFTIPGVVERALSPHLRGDVLPASAVSEAALKKSILFTLGEEWTTHAGRPAGLRNSVLRRPSKDWYDDPANDEPHDRGEFLVAAVMQTVIRMWLGRLRLLVKDGTLSLATAAEEGAKSATHLLNMAVRAIDYCPPLEFEFKDFLDGVIVADSEVAPDDEHKYRTALKDSFARYGIEQPKTQIHNLTDNPPVYDRLNFTALQSDADEVFRFIWENASTLELSRRYYTHVDQVWRSVRVGPDGFVVRETIATYVQSLEGSVGELRALSAETRRGPEAALLEAPAGVADEAKLKIWGGGTLIFDQFGRAKYHQTKPIDDWHRQSRRLAFLVRSAEDSEGEYGYARSRRRGDLRSLAHRTSRKEAW
jgi:hypothetical protein